MTRSYAAFTTLITQKLQSAGTADFTVSEVDNMIEETLKEYSHYVPHVVPIIFQVESRYGTCSSTSADNLTDTNKGQFVSGDATNEKVVHNTTDNTRAVVLTFTNTSKIAISRDIFVVDENYRIYNKQCWNSKQIYIADVPEFEDIKSVEYPIGEPRDWKILEQNKILEIDIDGGAIADSNAGSTVTELPDVDVLVRFNKPHVLSQLTDWAGNVAATAAAGATTLSASALQSAGTIEAGEEFYVENHKSCYIVAAETTIASNTVVISFYPPLEANISSTAWSVNFVKSSLLPNDEDNFADLAAARLAISKAPKFFNTIAVGGKDTGAAYQEWGERRQAQVIRKLTAQIPPKVKHTYTRE